MSKSKNSLRNLAEAEATQIAYELLMPKESVDHFLKKGLTPEEMANKFFVSPSAMTMRLINLYPELMIV